MVGATWLIRATAVGMWIAALLSMLATMGVVALPTSGLVLPAAATPGFATLGMLLVWHRPRNLVGRLMLGMGGLPAIGALLGVQEAAFLNGLVLVCFVLVLVVFPDGKLKSATWLVPVALLGIGWTTALVFPDFVWARSDGFEIPIGVALALPAVVWCATAPFARYRHAVGIERLQLRWLGATAGITGAAGVVALASVALQTSSSLSEMAGLITMIGATFGIPGSIFIAVRRYRLYNIDRVVSRTISYAIIVVTLGLVFAFGAIWLPTRLFGEAHPLFVAGSTLAVAALFNPLRRRIQRRVDRRFNRSAYQVEVVAEEFSARLRQSPTTEDSIRLWADTVNEHLQPATTAIWLNQFPK